MLVCLCWMQKKAIVCDHVGHVSTTKAMIWQISHCGILLTKPLDNFRFGYFVSDWVHTLKKSL